MRGRAKNVLQIGEQPPSHLPHQGFAEYGIIPATFDQILLLKVYSEDIDYYVGFNRRVGVTSGTVEGGDQVTVQSHPIGINCVKSILVHKLSARVFLCDI